MIEEIKNEIITIKDQMLKEYTIDLTNDKTREFYYIQCFDIVLRIIEEHNNQPDYKKMWEELKQSCYCKNATYEEEITYDEAFGDILEEL